MSAVEAYDKPAALAGRAIRVLLCDDHAVVRVGLKRLLDAADGVEVVGTAVDGADAVRQTLSADPDIVLMDLNMPTVDGVEATSRIAALLPGTAVLVLTSFGDRARIRGAIDAGARGYLLKDASPAELLAAIRGVVVG